MSWDDIGKSLCYLMMFNFFIHVVGLPVAKRLLKEIVVLPALNPEVSIILIAYIHYFPTWHTLYAKL